ncbi:hypothetical protein G6F57_017864 [Rhizopus arrhizus]|nr:hypothetical protein G6F57_017864 [Rhizopus arrhizus]
MGAGFTGRPPIQRAALPGRRLAAAMDWLPGRGQMDRVPVACCSLESAGSGAGGALATPSPLWVERRQLSSRKKRYWPQRPHRLAGSTRTSSISAKAAWGDGTDLFNGIRERRDPGNFHFHSVSTAHETRRVPLDPDTARGAGDDDVAWLQGRERRNIVKQARNAEYHLLGGCLLHDLTIEPGDQRQFLPVGNFVARRQIRPEPARLIELLAGGELTGPAI